MGIPVESLGLEGCFSRTARAPPLALLSLTRTETVWWWKFPPWGLEPFALLKRTTFPLALSLEREAVTGPASAILEGSTWR